jgi:hypothetical protein
MTMKKLIIAYGTFTFHDETSTNMYLLNYSTNGNIARAYLNEFELELIPEKKL